MSHNTYFQTPLANTPTFSTLPKELPQSSTSPLQMA